MPAQYVDPGKGDVVTHPRELLEHRALQGVALPNVYSLTILKLTWVNGSRPSLLWSGKEPGLTEQVCPIIRGRARRCVIRSGAGVEIPEGFKGGGGSGCRVLAR